ncbi:MAG TPA: DMT family transporter, partial [Rectinemataceae bacterium]|nr:DMT family transporter [Rectinemataceae bacterium]
MSKRGTLLFAALALIWGIPYLLIKVAMSELAPASLVFLRTAIGALILLPVVLLRGRFRELLPRWRPLLLYTLVEIGIPWVLLSDAERRVSSSLAGLLVASVPLVSAVMARITGGRDRLAALQIAGLCVGLGGVFVLLGFDVGGGQTLALLEIAVVVLGYALGPLVISRGLAGLPTLDVVAASLAVSALAYAPAGIALLPRSLPGIQVIGAVAGLGAVCTALAFVVFFKLIAEVGPTRATVVTYLNPAVAVAAGVLVLGEPFTLATGLGFVLIIAGAWLATGLPGRRRETVELEPP